MSIQSVDHIEFARPTQSAEPPPLNSGDHLTRQEFEQRYEAHPEIKKAELIEGVVYMPSPARFGNTVCHTSE